MCLPSEPATAKTDLVTKFTTGQKVVVEDADQASGITKGQVLTVKDQDEDGDVLLVETGGWYKGDRFAPYHAPAPAEAKGVETFPAVTAVQVAPLSLALNPFNSGRTFTFKRGNDPVVNKPGWQVQEIPGFHPVPSLMVPHDLIEHEPGSPSTPEEEFKAIGTALYLRGETNFFLTNGLGNFTDAMIAGAIEPLFFHILNGNIPTSPYPTSNEATQPLANKVSEVTLLRFATKAVDVLSKKYGNDLAKVATIEASMVHFVGWARVGYRRAVNRFHGVDRKRLGTSYTQLWKLAETYLGFAQDGDVLTVTWRPENYTAEVRLNTSKLLKA